MPIPYHGETDFSIERFDTGISDTNGLNSLSEIISNINSSGVDIQIEQFIGNKELTDGGILGGMLELIRVHINDMKGRQELDASTAGEVYSSMFTASASTALDFLFKNIEVKQLDKQRSLDMIHKLYEIEIAKLESDKLQVSRKTEMFNLQFLKPLEHETMIEDIEKKHIEHIGIGINNDTLSYNLNTILPKEATVLNDKHLAAEEELNIRTYYKSTMQPVEKSILDDRHCLDSTECGIKQYYKDNIQPEEKLTAIANRQIAQTNVDIKGKELLIAQEELEIREKEVEIKTKELDLKVKEVDLKSKEIDIKTYELENILPAQVALTNAQASLATAQTCVANADCAIKNYYQTNIQPLEKGITNAKKFNEEVLTGGFTAEDSLNQKKIDQMIVQTELYVRQKESYDDTKYQKLLDTQVNYAAMIFADVEDVPDPLDFSMDGPVKTVFNHLVPEDEALT